MPLPNALSDTVQILEYVFYHGLSAHTLYP